MDKQLAPLIILSGRTIRVDFTGCPAQTSNRFLEVETTLKVLCRTSMLYYIMSTLSFPFCQIVDTKLGLGKYVRQSKHGIRDSEHVPMSLICVLASFVCGFMIQEKLYGTSHVRLDVSGTFRFKRHVRSLLCGVFGSHSASLKSICQAKSLPGKHSSTCSLRFWKTLAWRNGLMA